MFVLGLLSPDEHARFVERLNSGCQTTQAEVAAFRETVSAVGLTLPIPTGPPPALRDQLLARIAAESKTPALEPDHSLMVVVRGNDLAWLPGPAPGVSVRLFNQQQKTMIVRMDPGSRIPVHHHTAAEHCLVLEGAVSTGEITVHAGDYIFMPAGSTHGELHSETGCTFLIAYS